MKKVKVRMLTGISGGINAKPGEVVEVSAEEAERFAERGLGEIVRSTPRDRSKKATKKTAKKGKK